MKNGLYGFSGGDFGEKYIIRYGNKYELLMVLSEARLLQQQVQISS